MTSRTTTDPRRLLQELRQTQLLLAAVPRLGNQPWARVWRRKHVNRLRRRIARLRRRLRIFAGSEYGFSLASETVWKPLPASACDARIARLYPSHYTPEFWPDSTKGTNND